MLLVRAVYTIVISAEAVVVMSDCCNGWRTSRCYCGSVRSRPHLIGLLVAIVLGALLEWLYVTM